ncbi:hypothetical protein LI99_17190 [Mycolicibacterium smegmatis]|uniref:Uncharacterized protein n=1 Tax=Mycolicibacterium smegmatis (strain ATCC 700084 / mc(2)155) TaxID=246196 RepID=A0QXX0_MYCS2|nr:hypothetical protein MSMEG_3453 [Mycolicibacterium smegmatis MC2 155]AIU15219.1 hypothetical protein LI99_17190 [Mycolicibacterium smegmatis]AIU08594.1 hypothetical protein LJ00_17185 [Mycolicibacterium smegmatis MC2 155]AIU21842.1 hypothetical protein LI98_17195 [Mycolicibacterium smegmatis]TBH28444.1 hypothetical protein EYS45_29220 [Mycolicibacterium smegmatis MC2 155]
MHASVPMSHADAAGRTVDRGECLARLLFRRHTGRAAQGRRTS